MEINIIIALILIFIFGIIIGYLAGSFSQNDENVNNSNIKTTTGCGITEEEIMNFSETYDDPSKIRKEQA